MIVRYQRIGAAAAALVVIVSVAACGAGPGGGGGGGGLGGSQPLDQQLPDEIGGVELQTDVESSETAGEAGLSVDEEFLDRIEGVGGSRDTVEIGFSHDPSGELPASILAIRAPGVDTGRFESEFLEAVNEDADSPFEQQTVAGKRVWVGEQEGSTAYLYFRGDTVFEVFAQDQASAESVLSALP